MSKSKVPRIAPPQAPIEPCLKYPGNFFSLEWTDSENVKELAYGLRLHSELAMLAYKGLRVHEEDSGTPRHEVYEMVGALVSGVSTGAFVLAKKLEALPEDSDHSDELATFKTREEERAETHLEWIRQIGHDALVAAHDDIEREYRKLGTNLLMKEAAKDLKPKDGA